MFFFLKRSGEREREGESAPPPTHTQGEAERGWESEREIEKGDQEVTRLLPTPSPRSVPHPEERDLPGARSPARSSGQEPRPGLGLPVASIQSAPSSPLMGDSPSPLPTARTLAPRGLGACRSPEVSLFPNQG